MVAFFLFYLRFVAESSADVGEVVESQPVSHPCTTIVPDHVETIVAQTPHHGDEFGGDLPLVPRPGVGQQATASRLPSFSDRTEHLAEDRLCRQHLGELFDQRL